MNWIPTHDGFRSGQYRIHRGIQGFSLWFDAGNTVTKINDQIDTVAAAKSLAMHWAENTRAVISVAEPVTGG